MDNFYGDNIRWFMGIVKDLKDPIKMGRVRVRIFGVHSEDQQEIPDDKLPWAQVMAPVTEGGVNNQGNFLGIQTGARVFGIFLDGKNSQMPLVFGSIPHSETYTSENGKIESRTTTDVNAQGGDNEVQDPYGVEGKFDQSKANYQEFDHQTKRKEEPVNDEPQQTNVRKPVYPNNKVKRTPSGHVIEIDDTPGGERLQVFHKSGTLVEIQPNGDFVAQHKNGFRSVTGTDKLYVTGDVEWMVDGNITISASKDIVIGTDTKIKLLSTGQQQYYAKDDIFVETDGAYNNVSTDTFFNANGPMDIRGTRIDLAKADPIAPAPEDFAFAGIEPVENATAGGGGTGTPQAVDGSGGLGPQDGSGGPLSAGDVTEPGNCTRKNLGSISSKYESNGKPGAIGNDTTGGFSYGSYQIATKTGTMKEFFKFVESDDRYKKFGTSLNNAGGTSGASSGSSQFQNEWKRLANNDPDFGQAQHDFIQGSHHNPAVRKIKQSTGIDVCDGSWSNGVQDAVWSTAVQHGSGGANTIVQRALARTGKTASNVTDQELISAIYAERGKKNASGNLHYFRNSTSGVQNSVANRFIQEEKDALANSTRTLNRELAATSTASAKGFYTG